jgi:hypothetical protein
LLTIKCAGDLRPTEQTSTLKEVASIKDDSINKHQLSSSNISTQMKNDNYVLNVNDSREGKYVGTIVDASDVIRCI